jgi:uroporphyrinogen-III synthase
VQIRHLFAVAATEGRAEGLAGQMQGLVIASIGPVCSRALVEHGITPTFEASPPKLGPLLKGLESAWSS